MTSNETRFAGCSGPRADRVAIIPAREASKQLPRNNSRDFLGKPAIAYPIEARVAAAYSTVSSPVRGSFQRMPTASSEDTPCTAATARAMRHSNLLHRGGSSAGKVAIAPNTQ